MNAEITWKECLLRGTETIEHAVSILERTSLRIILVVDQNQVLLGTVTDGDIRRGLIRHLSMQTQITEIMNNSPLSVPPKLSRDAILSLMREKDVLQLPVVDKLGVVVGLEVMQGLLNVGAINNTVVLMAGGFGIRLRPLTDDTPKPMLKVAGKPILESILDQFIEQGFHEFFISVHYRKEVVKEYFEDGSRWGVSIQYLEEETPLGTACALSLLPKPEPDLPVIVMNGDLLTTVNFVELLKYHSLSKSNGSVCVRGYDLEIKYGVVKSLEGRITELVEKPTEKFFLNAGIYVMDWGLIQRIKRGGRFDMTDVLNEAITDNQVITMFPVHEAWLDIGAKEQYEEAMAAAVDIV